MYVANIGKKRINATLLNILLGVLVLRSKRKKRKTSLNMILCIEDDGVVKSEATGKQILNWPVCYTVLQIGHIIINADVYACIAINFFKYAQLL